MLAMSGYAFWRVTHSNDGSFSEGYLSAKLEQSEAEAKEIATVNEAANEAMAMRNRNPSQDEATDHNNRANWKTAKSPPHEHCERRRKTVLRELDAEIANGVYLSSYEKMKPGDNDIKARVKFWVSRTYSTLSLNKDKYLIPEAFERAQGLDEKIATLRKMRADVSDGRCAHGLIQR